MKKETIMNLFGQNRPSVNLVKRYPNRFLSFLFHVSGLDKLRCRIKGLDLLAKAFHLFMAGREEIEASFSHLAFCVLLGFRPENPLKVETPAEKIRRCRFTPERFFELADRVKIYLG